MFAYRILFLPLFLLVLPYYTYRMLKRGGYGRHFSHRFGLFPKIPKHKKRIWIQAVSVGEVRALQPLIEELQAQNNFEIFLTTTTSTGLQTAEKLFANKIAFIGVFPLNFWLFSALAWRRIQPTFAFLTESELWPEHLQQACRHKVPLFLLNGRMSEKSFRRYQQIPTICRWLFAKITHILASSDESRQHFIQLGCPAEKIVTVGNLKLDLSPSIPPDSAMIAAQKRALGFPENATILFGASTWPSEETMLANVLKNTRLYSPNTYLILLPRHPERRNDISNVLKQTHFSFSFRTDNPSQPNDIYVADTIGEMHKLLPLADIVYVGKSMAPNKGGQSPVDAALFGKPILYGPYMDNFKPLCKMLEEQGAAFRCNNEEALEHFIKHLLEDTAVRTSMGHKAALWQQSNQGATAKTLEALKALGV
ncbi:MAG: hypothetical protein A2Y14_03945 [Verrucomicrobia bacterium GWF2_51_19]|nr:MAG: hypothetical protein A2Y14_03945 [Verrucomicrobia bacterium GWF2_51_19]